jgi:hypothetical protein
MRRSSLGLLVVVSSFAAALGCGSSDNGNGGPGSGDGGGVDGAPRDGSNGGHDTGLPPPPADAAPVDANLPPPPPPQGTQIANAQGPSLLGVTTDGYVIYADGMGNVFAQSTSAGDAGAPIAIQTAVKLGAFGFIGVVGRVVFVWPDPTQKSPLATLTVWSKATGAHTLMGAGGTPAKTYAGVAAASDDGSKIIYAVVTDGIGGKGDVIGSAADLTAPVTLTSGAVLGGAPNATPPLNTNCSPSVGFAGAGHTDGLVAACTPNDAAANVATLTAYTGATWTAKTLASNLEPLTPSTYTLDATAANIMAVTTTGEMESIAYPLGTVSPLEASAGFPAFYVGSAALPTAVYSMGNMTCGANPCGPVHSSSVPATTPVALTTANVLGVFGAPSPGDAFGIYVLKGGSAAGGLFSTTDVNVFKTAAPPIANAAVDPNADAVFFGPPFTADAHFLLWYNGVQQVGNGGAAANLNLYATASLSGAGDAGPSGMFAVNVWQHWTTTASKIVYNDNSIAINNGNEVVADIKVADVSVAPPAPTSMQQGAEATFLLTPDLKTVIYAFNQGSTAAQNGVWLLPIP